MPGVQQGVNGLLVILTEGARARVALELAATAAAMGRPVAVLLKCWPVPDLALLDGLGVEVVMCQTALAEAGGDARRLPAGVTTGGMVGVLRGRESWQLALA